MSDYVDTWIARVHPPAERLDGSICPVCRHKGVMKLKHNYALIESAEGKTVASYLDWTDVFPCGCEVRPHVWAMEPTQFFSYPRLEWVRQKVMIR